MTTFMIAGKIKGKIVDSVGWKTAKKSKRQCEKKVKNNFEFVVILFDNLLKIYYYR